MKDAVSSGSEHRPKTYHTYLNGVIKNDITSYIHLEHKFLTQYWGLLPSCRLTW